MDGEVDTTCVTFNILPTQPLTAPFTEFTLVQFGPDTTAESLNKRYSDAMSLVGKSDIWGMQGNAWGFESLPEGVRAVFLGGWEDVEVHQSAFLLGLWRSNASYLGTPRVWSR